MIKRLLKSLCLLALVSVFFGCSSDKPADNQAALTRVKLGDLRSEFWLPVYVAQEKGFFKEQGLDVDFIVFADGPVELQSALSGEIDFAVLSIDPTLIAYDKGLKSKVLLATLKNKPFMLVANSNIKSVQDLKGQKIAAGTPGSSPYAFICSILKENGLDPRTDVELVNMSYGASLVAFEKNQIQATFLDSTRFDKNEMKDITVLVDTADPQTHLAIYKTDKYEASIVISSQDYINKNPETTQRFINALYKAIQWQQISSDAEIATLIKPYFDPIDMEPIIARTRSSLSKDGLISQEGYNAMLNFALNEGLIKTSVPFDSVIDLSFIQKSIAQGK